MASFETYCPKLRAGQILPEGSKVIYETNKDFQQVIFPIEMADMLVLCDGSSSMREIIEKLYKKNGTVHFRNIFKAIFYLKEQKILENGDDLEAQLEQIQPRKAQSFFSFKTISELPLGKRIFNDKPYPALFYVAAMAIIVSAIISIERVLSFSIDQRFFEVGKSYVNGIVYFIVAASVLLTFKNMLKCLMLIFLTGRAYNLRLVFNGFAFYVHVGIDSLFLITNKLYLALFHGSLTLSYIVFAVIFQHYFPYSGFSNQLMVLALALTFFDLNPYQESEISDYFRSIYDDEGLLRLASYFNSKSILSLISPEARGKGKVIYHFFSYYAFFWGVTALYFCGEILTSNWTHLILGIQNLDLIEKLASAFILISLLALGSLVLINLFKSILANFITPLTRWFLLYKREKRSEKISNYSDSDIIETLSDLPLFSYFSDELLKVIVDRSELKKFKKGVNVIVQGDMGTNIYVLLHGVMQVQKNTQESISEDLAEIHAISIFGEVAAIEQCQRTASVLAKIDSLVLCVPSTVIAQAAKESQYIREIHSFRNAIMVNQYFTSAPLFKDLPASAIHLFTTRGKIEDFTTGQVIFNQGTIGDSFYLIIRGTVAVNINGNKVNEIHQGGFFGEISVIADVPRTATIYAQEPTMVLKIHADAFWEILAQNIEMALFIEAVGEMRIKEDIEILAGKEKQS